MELDKVFENLKIEASVKEDFNLIDAFSLLDVNGLGYIKPTDLRAALFDLGIKCNIDEIELIFQRYANSSDGVLKYSEF
jgi:Ca2+-binding EF-hand superfamily protein